MTVMVGDCRETLQTLADNSVDSIVTDPPYEIGFMGKGWDGSGVANDPTLWAECYRVLKPGGHVLAFGAARTYHRMACAIEDAGFEIRDSLHWVYGSGFPKSHNVSKGIDKAAGTLKVIGKGTAGKTALGQSSAWNKTNNPHEFDLTEPGSDDAKRWEGWGTALKPAHEPIVMARKPFAGTVASNVLEHGTGAINIDGARIGETVETWPASRSYAPHQKQPGHIGETQTTGPTPSGRWPANVILTHSTECDSECAQDCPAREIDQQSGNRPGASSNSAPATDKGFTRGAKGLAKENGYNDNGGASRFYAQPEWAPGDYLASVYTPKAGKRERNAGLDGMPYTFSPTMGNGIGGKEHDPETATPKQNHHPTVKPVALMRYLIRLVTPPGGLVLDPFLGSGTTAVAAILEGFEWIGCELTADYLPIIEGRTTNAKRDYPATNTIQNSNNTTQTQMGLFDRTDQ